MPARPRLRPARRVAPLLALAAATLAGACASAGGAAPGPGTTPAAGTGTGSSAATPAAAQAWTPRPREVVDLWLHGFALLVDDTSRVPIFRRGYREQVRAVRQRANAYTQLDAERDRLVARLRANPTLALGAQFAALPFDSWEEMRAGLEALVATGGDPRRASDQQRAAMVAYLAPTFPTAVDREWARLFGNALQDEYARFYHQHWLTEQRARSGILAAADSVWQRAARPRLGRFLSNTQQRDGLLILSLVLGGEGRTQGGGGGGIVAVGFPAPGGDPAEPTYTAVHELVGAVAGAAVADHVTPSEQRAGVADRHTSAAQVRGGLLLLQRLAPDLAPGYARFYLREAGAAAGSDPAAALAAAFPLPTAIAESLRRQLETVLGGI